VKVLLKVEHLVKCLKDLGVSHLKAAVGVDSNAAEKESIKRLEIYIRGLDF